MVKKLSFGEIALLLVILALVVVLLYSVVQIADTLLRDGDSTNPDATSQGITVDGVDYFPRQDIVVILVAGIDETGPVKDSGAYNNSGEADMVTLVIIDKTAKKIDLLALNRDTMVNMPVLGVDGKYAGNFFGQLALAHTYGSGLKDSAQNLKKAVSDLLFGLEIDHYVTMNMDAISILNDAVGGVTVTVEDDFSAVDDTIGMGSVTLNGKQAVSFLRARQDVGDQLNLTRMKRQKDYVNGFMQQLKIQLDKDATFATSAYSAVESYIVTDLTSKGLLGLVEYYGDYEVGQIFTLEGESIVNEYVEYHLDEQKLTQMVLDLFYDVKS